MGSKSGSLSRTTIRAFMNANPEEILANPFWGGLPEEVHYEVSSEFKDDMALGWNQGGMTSVDAFYHYYSHFTREQDYLEANLTKLVTPVTVVWGSDDLYYISKEMGIELADRIQAPLKLLAGVGHHPHLQAQKQTIEEIRASFQ
ncbi:alpha/beta hydrolase [Neorhizobium sp. P12A]|uniref:alpha/beta fold hydrolase n=1 Tax=Neorhizobium sp. P12A TaxID=2268027 RepID=UPI001FEF0B83|nr:alpha/beta hydrolase [Neorhizobium sp. P12A]